MNNHNGARGGGIGICGVLAIVFIVLKLCNVIEWSWVWVLAPLWIPAAIVLVLFTILGIVTFFSN